MKIVTVIREVIECVCGTKRDDWTVPCPKCGRTI